MPDNVITLPTGETVPILDETYDECKNELGAKLINLLDRCIGLPGVAQAYNITVPEDLLTELNYIRDNAKDVVHLLTRLRAWNE